MQVVKGLRSCKPLKSLKWPSVCKHLALRSITRLEFHLNNPWFSKLAVWLVIALVLFTVFKQFDSRGQAGNGYLAYSDFLEEVRGKRIKSATIQEGQGGTEIVAITTDDRKVRTNATYLDRGLVGDLIANNVKFDVKPREEGSLLMTLLVSWGPMLLLIGVWVYFMRQMQGGGGKGGSAMKPKSIKVGNVMRLR